MCVYLCVCVCVCVSVCAFVCVRNGSTLGDELRNSPSIWSALFQHLHNKLFFNCTEGDTVVILFYFVIRISKSNVKNVGNSGFRSFKMLLSTHIVASGPQIYTILIFSVFYFFYMMEKIE